MSNTSENSLKPFSMKLLVMFHFMDVKVRVLNPEMT